MKIYVLVIITLSTFSCNRPSPDRAQTREMYNAGDQHVITSFASRKLQTMSVLYGNQAAKKFALSNSTTHLQGELFTLVVYKQADNKYWYGSYINGAVKSIETVSTPAAAGEANKLTYKLQEGRAPKDSWGRQITAADRISYILSHKPSVFP